MRRSSSFSPAATLVLAALLCAPAAARAQRAVFVVRHAEKISDTDERLSDAGRARAARLAGLLKNAGVTAIYATDTERARDTAGPLAQASKVTVAIYDTGGTAPGAASFAGRLRAQNANDAVLVVGHSNTVPEILRALGCVEEVTIDKDQYDDLFVAVPGAKGTTLVRLRY